MNTILRVYTFIIELVKYSLIELQLTLGWSERIPMKLIENNGKLWITFYHQSKRYRRSLSLDDTKKNRKLAEQQLIPEILYELNNGTFFKKDATSEIPILDEFSNVSFDIHKHERRLLTQKDYRSKYQLHIQPTFGSKPLDKIKPSHLAKWQNQLLETHASKTVRSIRTVFQTILEDALMDDIISINPFKRVKTPKHEEFRKKIPFSKEEVFEVLNEMTDSIRGFFAVGFFTGMRTGELIGLKWEDVDWDDRIIKVRRSRRQGVDDKPKTRSSIRDVEIIDALWPYLLRHRELSSKKSIYIFETSRGEPFNTCAKISSWYWRPALKRLGLEYRNLYLMRHTFASLMISHGEDILWVSNMLGHKDSSTTLEKYARYIKRTDKARATFLQ